jgi:hypothetical protein
MDTGFVTLDNSATVGGQNIKPYPSSDPQVNCDILLGGTGVAPVAAAAISYTYTLTHQNGLYISNVIDKDDGDNPEVVGQTASTLAGAWRGRTWASNRQREVSYQLMTVAQFEAARDLFADSRNNLILIDESTATFAEYAENYIIISPEKMPENRYSPGFARYAFAWTLGKI